MLPKTKRVPREMFPLVSKGKAVSSDIFLLKFVNLKQTGKMFCFSVSKKIAKNAVLRNKLRRSGYRLIEKYIPLIKTNVLAVFYFKKIPESDEKMEKSIKFALKESKIINND